ncbi:CRISPR-associated helicase/endonuclease Cas3 [Anaerosalibacter massiliensis]|uniref:CRISPR-associated helicase/endonuclease Cas3 n=1 Tax=Anaerosalibacter massiliensis TaxID=1347392 RepID=A0A9X2S5Z9_9FIRM|nr:CRISPR-associated helicase/endonuclease Cas3 [Anaerosalibacter massiliensis]MCR2045105.1 CRISPR-associated helicase/endonuclease Cas3 [Anaerosalibacter massiliensis]
MNKYLAKSNPQETIYEHTDNLLKNYEIFKRIYSDLKIDWNILYLACLYHDFGKMNLKFQQKIEYGKRYKDEVPHGILSLAFLNTRELKMNGYTNEQIKLLAHSIAYHHDRDFNYDNELINNEIELLKNEINNFSYNKVQDIKVKKISAKYFCNDRIYEKEDEKLFFKYVMIKGFLNRIDYAASGYIEVEKENNFLMYSMNNMMEDWRKENPDSDWNELQNYMIDHQNENVIVVAQTGMGKTEAGLLWIGDNKGFFTLPLKTAINSIYKRVSHKILKCDFKDRVGLLHSDTYSEYLNIETEDLDIDEYYNKTKQLSLPLTICTLDQIFDFVYRYRGFESKLATLSYSKVVIDEIQMYSPDLLAYLIIGLSYITKVGGKFTILTATLPNIVLDFLNRENIEFTMPEKPFIDNTFNRHNVKIIESEMNIDPILKLYENNKVLVICNTVRKAQEIYEQLKKKQVKNLNLFHSGFIKKDRKEKEDAILEIGKKDSIESGIWVTTQVVEASLDIDFDILITELSDINGLFQRMGRCYRKREFTKDEYNCYVFNGGNKKCSGVGYVVDREIFNLSKEYLKNVDGILTEKNKVDLINSLYTTDNLKDTDYYKLIESNIEYVKRIEDFEKSKAEIKSKFRNINTITVIPKQVYDDNYEEIREYVDIISQRYDKKILSSERQQIKHNKIIARNRLRDFTVSIQYYLTEGNIIEYMKLNRNEVIPILNCNYSKELGIQVIKNKKGQTSPESRSF